MFKIVIIVDFDDSKFLSVLFYCSFGVICIFEEAGRFWLAKRQKYKPDQFNAVFASLG